MLVMPDHFYSRDKPKQPLPLRPKAEHLRPSYRLLPPELNMFVSRTLQVPSTRSPIPSLRRQENILKADRTAASIKTFQILQLSPMQERHRLKTMAQLVGIPSSTLSAILSKVRAQNSLTSYRALRPSGVGGSQPGSREPRLL